MKNTYTVYVQTDSQNRVVAITSSAFLSDLTGWTAIDEGKGDAYLHAQNNYLDGPLYTQDGFPLYKLQSGKVVERSTDEIDADRAALPKPAPSDSERLAALEAAMLTMMMTGGASHV